MFNFDGILDRLVKGLSAYPAVRSKLLRYSIPVFFLAVLFYLFSYFNHGYEVPEQLRIAFLAAMAMSALAVLLCLVSYLLELPTEAIEVQAELAPLRVEREAIQRRLAAHDEPGDVLQSIQLSLNQLSEYYTISKGQARGSFRVSVAAMILGFVTLIGGVWLFFFQSSDTRVATVATLSAIGGVLSQFLAASYFYLYRTTIAQMNYFYDRLVSLQDTMLSIRLCEGIDDKPLQLALKEKIVVALLAQQSRAVPSATAGLPSSAEAANDRPS
ncbi:MAG: hypothetical protein DCC68_07940 [Planctomycetota bacterium]|nr:MAG: hypothetical protein DCC68_07940 [Planctomycetota bacterium]